MIVRSTEMALPAEGDQVVVAVLSSLDAFDEMVNRESGGAATGSAVTITTQDSVTDSF